MKVQFLIVVLALIAISFTSAEDKPIQVDKTTIPPVLIKKVDLKIPDALKDKKIRAGVIILEVIISNKGDVTNVKVLRSLDHLLDQEATTAAKQWKYKPALKDGKPVSVYFTITSIIHVQ
jgi:TonB family protein